MNCLLTIWFYLEQAPHTDYVPTPDLVDLLECDEKIPLLAIATIMPGTKINVWPNSIRKIHHTDTLYEEPIMCKTLEMDVGDVLIFRADLVHAGSSYDTENTRVHVYLDSPYVKRNPNKTWVIKSSYNKNNALNAVSRFIMVNIFFSPHINREISSFSDIQTPL